MLFVEMALIFYGFYFLFLSPPKRRSVRSMKRCSALAIRRRGHHDRGHLWRDHECEGTTGLVVRVADNTKIEIGKAFIQAATKKPVVEEKKSS